MYQAFNSDDGKLKGVSKEEVEKYEAGLENPLSRMRFPYVPVTRYNSGNPIHTVHAGMEDALANRNPVDHDTLRFICAFANLAPLIAECEKEYPSHRKHSLFNYTPLARLLDAYDEAVALIPKP